MAPVCIPPAPALILPAPARFQLGPIQCDLARRTQLLLHLAAADQITKKCPPLPLKFRSRAVSGEPSAAAQLRHDMTRVFGDLKPRERALLWLAHVEELSHAELAEALGLKAKSVKVLLFRARKKLAEHCTKRGLGPEALR